MRFLIPCIFLMILRLPLQGQPYVIEGSIQHAGDTKVYLASYYGDSFRITDSISASGGSYQFIIPGLAPAGVYRLIYSEIRDGVYSENRFVEFIFNQENLIMNVSLEDRGPVPHFENSLENQVYSEFVSYQLDYEAELTGTYPLLQPSRPGNPVYEAAVTYYEDLQRNRIRFLDSLSTLYPELYATRIMNAFRAPVIPGNMSHEKRIDTLKSVFFESAPIDDPALLYAPVYTFRIVDYLSLYRSVNLGMEEQEEAYIEAVDQIMVNVSEDSALRQFVVGFLLQGFDLLDMEPVLAHLADIYMDETCQSDLAEMVRERTIGYRKMAVGSEAPDFVIRDTRGRNIVLSEMTDPYVLVVFWASNCGHCQAFLPELNRWYRQENTMDLEVVAISIDTSEAFYEKYMEEHPAGWISSRDPLGWNGKVPADYHIYATPSVFLLDRHRKILAKPATFRQFRRDIGKLED